MFLFIFGNLILLNLFLAILLKNFEEPPEAEENDEEEEEVMEVKSVEVVKAVEVDSSDDEEEELELPTIEVDGKSYLYDEDGDYSGINHLLLTEEGTPVGTYDKETNKVTILEFEEE